MMRANLLALLLAFGSCVTARAGCPTPILPDGRIGYGIEGLPIPPVNLKDETAPRTVELLGKALGEPQRTTAQRIQLVFDLGNCKMPDSTKYVREILKDTEPSIRAEAARSAAKLGDASMIGDLKSLLSDADPTVRREVILAGAALGDASFVAAGLKEKDPLLLRSAIGVASKDHADALAAMLPELPMTLRVEAIRALGRIGASAHAGDVAKYFDADVPQRAAAARAVGQMKAVAQLAGIERLLADPHPTVRREAVAALAGVAEASVQQRHAIERLGDDDRSVREAAATILVGVPTRDAVELLVKQLDEDYHPLFVATRAALVAAGKDTVPAAARLLDHNNPRRREDGSYLLGELRSDEAFERHLALMNDPDWQLVQQVAHSLGRIGRKDATPVLFKLASRAMTLMDDANAKKDYIHSIPACREAIVSCGLLGYAQVLPPIVAMIPQREQFSGELRGAAIWAFGMVGDENDASVQGSLNGVLGDIKEGEAVKFEAIKAWGNQRHKAALGIVQNWSGGNSASPSMFSGSPNMRWIMHWTFDRITGKEAPYTPPSGSRSADVSIADLPAR
jgi:HEAT repeat protein